MADSVRVITEEWKEIQGQIQTKVDDINETLDEFTGILNDLATNGFIEEGAHEPILSFKGNVEDIKDCLSYIHTNITTVINDYLAEIEKTDHNSLQ